MAWSVTSEELVTKGDLPLDIIKIDPPSGVSDHIIVIIPGNPGVGECYKKFGEYLYTEMKGNSSVWIVSFACFSKQAKMIKDEKITSPLEREVEHKILFLEHHVPKTAKLTLVGHSIGCYMIMCLLQILLGKRPRKYPLDGKTDGTNLPLYHRIKDCYLLCPAVEKIRSSPYGKLAGPTVDYIQRLVYLVFCLLWSFPTSWKRALVNLTTKTEDEELKAAAMQRVMNPKTIQNVMTLAKEEFDEVIDIDEDCIRNSKDKLIFYYSKSDGWCPLQYREKLLEKIPDYRNILDEHGAPHIFMYKHADAVAKTVSKCIVSSF